jgi:hypothetical protein
MKMRSWMGIETLVTRLVGLVVLTALSLVPGRAEEVGVDPMTGLKLAPGWELVRNHCVACHSAKQFLQQRGTRETWRSVIRWMQGRAGLWALDGQTEEGILDYLETNHGPGEEFRRPPIPAHLMPQNPYASAARKEYEERLKSQEKK